MSFKTLPVKIQWLKNRQGAQCAPPQGQIELTDYCSKNKKSKGTKKCVVEKKLKFGKYRNCLKVVQLKNKINNIEKNEIDIDSLIKDNKEFINSNKLILKTQRRFKSERHIIRHK